MVARGGRGAVVGLVLVASACSVTPPVVDGWPIGGVVPCGFAEADVLVTGVLREELRRRGSSGRIVRDVCVEVGRGPLGVVPREDVELHLVTVAAGTQHAIGIRCPRLVPAPGPPPSEPACLVVPPAGS